MASNNQTKNMTLVYVLKTSIIKILTSTLKWKDAEKAINYLQSEESRETLTRIINENSSKKIVRKPFNKKDPNAPKRCCSSYIFYCKYKRNKIKENNPDMDSKEIVRELGRSWREDLSDEEKQPFVDEASKDKTRYDEQKSNYTLLKI